jgi:hypothetical protein
VYAAGVGAVFNIDPKPAVDNDDAMINSVVRTNQKHEALSEASVQLYHEGSLMNVQH